jgi:hypothetical protein
MRIYTKIISQWDEQLQRYVTVESEWFDYAGEVALCKGDNTDKQAEQASLENEQQQNAFSAQLMDVFKAQYGQQQGVLNYLQGKMQPMIDNPTGYGDKALTAMRTSSDDQISNQYQNAQKTLQSNSFAMGGRDLPSGVDSQLAASLLNGEAQDKAGAQNQITMADENLKQSNYWNAVNTLNGVGTEYNPQSYAGASTGASGASSGAAGAVASTSQANTAASNSGFLSKLAGGFGSALGSGLAGGLTGGLGTGVSMLGSGNFGW